MDKKETKTFIPLLYNSLDSIDKINQNWIYFTIFIFYLLILFFNCLFFLFFWPVYFLPPWHHVIFTFTEKFPRMTAVSFKCHLSHYDLCFTVKEECTEYNSSDHLSHCRHQSQCDLCASMRKLFTARQRLHGSSKVHAIKPGFKIINAPS